MTLLFTVTQLGIFLFGVGVFLHALVNKKLPIFVFLISDAFVFEYLILKVYHPVVYNPNLINIFGIPLMIVIGWAVLLYSYIVTVKSQNLFVSSVLTALSLTLVDLVMEYPMVNFGLWRWVEPIGYLHIPYKNFFAWFIYGFLVTFFVCRQTKNTSLARFLIIFNQITFLGFIIGFVWNLLPLYIQKISFWSLVGFSSIIVLRHKMKLAFEIKYAYLLIVPVIFFIYSLSLIVFTFINGSLQIIFDSLIFVVFWIFLTAMILRNSIYISYKYKHPSNFR